MNLNKPAVIKKLQERFRNVNAGRGLYTAFLVPTMLTMFSTRAFAADTIWTKASAIMQDVYTQILGISTIAAVVTAAIALLLPEGVIAIEVDQAVAKKLFGQTIAIRCYDNTVEHTVGEVNGSYWFKVDIGSQEGESNYEEEP